MINLVDIQCFPCINFFKRLAKCTYIEVEIYDRFRKMSFHNRFIVAGANGLINLTVPIIGGREQKKLIAEIEIDNTTDWQKKHWRTLVSCYRKAPFFDYYAEEIKTVIFNKEKSLLNFDVFILNKMCKWLNISVEICFTSEFKYHIEADYRNRLLPKNFQDNTINWEPKYAQVFEDRIGFQPNLSILDLLFNVGPSSSVLLDKTAVKGG